MKTALLNWLSSPTLLRRLFNIYGPFLGAGIKVTKLSRDWQYARVEMPLRWYNRNYVNTHFGGSLYAMVDPFYMLLLMNRLGKHYEVWDQAADITYVAPGRGRVYAEFTVHDGLVEEVKTATETGEKYLPTLKVEVRDQEDQLIAICHKTLYVRKKRRFRHPAV